MFAVPKDMAKIGYKFGKDKRYRRMGAKGVTRQLQQTSCTVESMILLRIERPFLESILKEANRNKRQEMLEHANADQINAVSEMVLSLLRNRILVHPITMAKLQKYKTTLCEVGKRRNWVKR